MSQPNPNQISKIFLTWKIYLIPDDKTTAGRIKRAKALGFESKFAPLLMFLFSLCIAMAIVVPRFPIPRNGSILKLVGVILAEYFLATVIATALTLLSGKGYRSNAGNQDSEIPPDA